MSPHILAPLLGLCLASHIYAQGWPTEGVAAEVASHGQKDVIAFSEVRDLAAPQEKEALDRLKGEDLVAKLQEIRTAAVHVLVDRTLILHEFKAQDRTIPETLVDGRIEAIIKDRFAGDRTAFLRKLAANGYTLGRFREREREELIVQQMRGEAAEGAMNAEDAGRLENEWLKTLRSKAYIKVYWP
jgi:hypothetical protein